jgi:hypothetical protein
VARENGVGIGARQDALTAARVAAMEVHEIARMQIAHELRRELRACSSIHLGKVRLVVALVVVRTG